MKNTIKWFGVIALVAVIGFSMAACGDGDDDDSSTKYSGTSWQLYDGWVKTYVFNSSNGVSWHRGAVTVFKGTYTVSGKDINITITSVDPDYSGSFKVGDKEKLTVSADGKTLTDSSGDIYDKRTK
jgi:hypothetical protein